VKIYLDVCCLNRPLMIRVKKGYDLNRKQCLHSWTSKTVTLLSSEIVDIEISKIPDEDRKQKVILLSSISR